MRSPAIEEARHVQRGDPMRRLEQSQRARVTAWSAVDAYELPTTMRKSGSIPVRSTPPPLPLKARKTMDRITETAPRPLPTPRPYRAEPLPSLSSILEPDFWKPSREAVVPPDPESFRPPPPRRAPWRPEIRWTLRIALLLFVIAGELVLADPTGALHRPRDLADGSSMLSRAAHASVTTALAR